MNLVVPIVAPKESEPVLALITAHSVVCDDVSGEFIHASAQLGDANYARVTQQPGKPFYGSPPMTGPRNILVEVGSDRPRGGPIMQFELDGEVEA